MTTTKEDSAGGEAFGRTSDANTEPERVNVLGTISTSHSQEITISPDEYPHLLIAKVEERAALAARDVASSLRAFGMKGCAMGHGHFGCPPREAVDIEALRPRFAEAGLRIVGTKDLGEGGWWSLLVELQDDDDDNER